MKKQDINKQDFMKEDINKQNIKKNQFNTPSNDSMKTAYKLGSKLVRDRLMNESKENIDILDEMDDSDVLVIPGTYDHIHLVLEHSDIPYKSIEAEQLVSAELRADQTIFVNCANYFPTEAARKLAGFVASGGQLITTDWALKNVLEVGFPGKVKYNSQATSDEVVRVELIEKDDPLLKGFIDEEAMPVWWLEGSSYPIEIIDPENVKVLMRSKELKEKYGEEAVIISFSHGKGVVYHMISHFYLQRTETRDAKQEMKSSNYSSMKGASKGTQAIFEEADMDEDLNYGMVQSASTSTEFVNRALINQKKKFRKKKDKSI